MHFENVWVLLVCTRAADSWVVPESKMLDMFMEPGYSSCVILDCDRWSEVITGYVSLSEYLLKERLNLDFLQDRLKFIAGYDPDTDDHEDNVEVVTLVKASVIKPSLLRNVFDRELHLITGLPVDTSAIEKSVTPKARKPWEL